MIIKAKIRLLEARNGRQVFLMRGQNEHGIAKGPVSLYQVTGSSFAGIKRTLEIHFRESGVMGLSNLSADTVDSYTKDIGSDYARLRKLADDICATCGGVGEIGSPAGSRTDRWPCPDCPGPAHSIAAAASLEAK